MGERVIAMSDASLTRVLPVLSEDTQPCLVHRILTEDSENVSLNAQEALFDLFCSCIRKVLGWTVLSDCLNVKKVC